MNWLDRAETLISRLPIRHRESHQMVPFRWNINQAKRWATIKKQWDTEGKIRIIDLKSRRVGVSSQSTALLWAYGMTFPHRNIKMVAHLAASAEDVFQVPAQLSKAFPGFSSDHIQNKRVFFHHKEGDGQLSIATAGTPSAGRGGTLSALFLDEGAYYPSDASFVSMITSVSKGPGSIVIISSTANGAEGPGAAFKEYWDAAVAGRNGYIPVFLTWLDDPACVRPAEEAEDAPADDLEKELMAPPFNASREQIAWMRRTKEDDCRGLEVQWLIEYPHCPEVAFQVSGQPAFARTELAYAQGTIREPLCRGSFRRTGQGMGFRFEREAQGPWHIWRFPFDAKGKPDGFKYYLGGDSAAGVEEGDFAAAAVLCGQTGELSARFSEIVDPEIFADQMDMAGRWYNTALVNPELTGGLGRWALVKLRDVYRYPNIYQWKGRDDQKRGHKRSNALGFEMTSATRRLIIDATRSGLRSAMRKEAGGLVVNDRLLMSQMSLCTLKEWRWEVARGHDDVLVAYAIACLTREQYPPPRMSFAPRNIMENTPQEKLAAAGVQVNQSAVPGYNSEMNAIFVGEMRKMMRSCGLNSQMRGSGKKSLDRLVGI
jgi:hypothetical protein